VFLLSLLQLLVAANVCPRSLIFSAMFVEATRSSETPDLPRATLRDIQEDCILNCQSYSPVAVYSQEDSRN
jgi:hypothetical protein